MKKRETLPRPRVELVGTNGNALLVLARVLKAGKKVGWTDEQCADVANEAKAGDYDNLLRVCMKYAEVD